MSRSTNCVHHPDRPGTHLRMRPAYSRLSLAQKYQYVCDECADNLVKEKREHRRDTILGSHPISVFTKTTNVFSQLQNASTLLEDLDEAAQKARRSA